MLDTLKKARRLNDDSSNVFLIDNKVGKIKIRRREGVGLDRNSEMWDDQEKYIVKLSPRLVYRSVERSVVYEGETERGRKRTRKRETDME